MPKRRSSAALQDASDRCRLFSSQRVAAVLDAAGDFGHPIRACGVLEFKLDHGLDMPLVVADQAQSYQAPCRQWQDLSRYGGITAVSYTHLTLPTNREV